MCESVVPSLSSFDVTTCLLESSSHAMVSPSSECTRTSSVSPATALYVNARKRGGFAYWSVCGLSDSIAPTICQRYENESDLVSKMSEKSSGVSVLLAGPAEHAATRKQLIRNRTVGF